MAGHAHDDEHYTFAMALPQALFGEGLTGTGLEILFQGAGSLFRSYRNVGEQRNRSESTRGNNASTLVGTKPPLQIIR
jgi:hypothetical protein